MAFGDLLVQLKAPAKPQGATETETQYLTKIQEAAAAHFVTTGITPARFSWVARSDAPDDAASVPAWTQNRIAETLINPDDYTFAVASTAVIICIVNGEVRYCSTVIPQPANQIPSGNQFVFNVALNNNLSATVEVRLVIRILGVFKGASS